MTAPHKEERAILESIRQGTAPSIIKRRASRGTIPVSADELLEILVFLTADPDPTCSEVAKQTLDGWPTEKCARLLAEPHISGSTLAYFAARPNLPPEILSALADHPNAGDETLTPLATRLSLEQIEKIISDPSRAEGLPLFLTAILRRGDLSADSRGRIESVVGPPPKASIPTEASLASEELVQQPGGAATETVRERIGLTQKIARLGVAERVQLALKGNKDERMILIRDGSKVVYRAVLQSPKLGDSEVEAFTQMKNVAEEVLRIIAGERKFMKNYVVARNLVNNPRTPLDVGLPLLNRLTNKDLKFLSLNRNVPETVRTMAGKLHRQRTTQKRSTGF